MAIPFLIIIGVAAGFIASKVMKTNLSLVETIAIGILGAIIGGLVLRGLIVAGSMIFGLVGAVAGAC
ncbi:MAG: GlsB/YeaQ/YmgE family stress response membrane protein, partial [Paracoccaceae bacterium]|nr:GlsB/YeaQ/YmgE family stress response membrane protein [Paracoccaceae bacterium]